jgi:ribosomal protein S18 acetylase RimI-like enzyme
MSPNPPTSIPLVLGTLSVKIFPMIRIRTAKKTEWPKLQDLNNEVFIDNQKYDADLVRDWSHSKAGKKYFQELVDDPKSLCLVAEADSGELVGYLAASPKPISHRKSKYFEVDNMGVTPDHRSKGIGQKLMERCVKKAKERGYQKVYVNSYSSNAGAIKFYKKYGYSEIDISLELEI